MNKLFSKKVEYEDLGLFEDENIDFAEKMNLGNLDLTHRRKFYLIRIGGVSPMSGYLHFKIQNVKKMIKIEFEHMIKVDKMESYTLRFYENKEAHSLKFEISCPKGRSVKSYKERKMIFKKCHVFHIYKKNKN